MSAAICGFTGIRAVYIRIPPNPAHRFAHAGCACYIPDMTKSSRTVVVNDRMQRGYVYALTAPAGGSFDAEFHPELTPKQMLALGVFGGKYMTDCRDEFPASWFARARLSRDRRAPSLNYFRGH